MHPNPKPWNQVSSVYQFVDDFVSIRSKVTGTANLVRFDFWASTFMHMQAVAKAECVWGEYNANWAKVTATTRDPVQRRVLSKELLIPARANLIQQTGVIFGHLQQAICSTGTMGTVMNIEQRSVPSMLDVPGLELAAVMGYIGCYNDKQDRDLNGTSVSNGQMTPGQCLSFCKSKGFAYYGNQFGTYCFCGNTYGRYGAVAYNTCNMSCAGDGSVDCGGTWENSVYSVAQSALPDSAIPPSKYSGAPRLIVPTARSDLGANEVFTLTTMVLSEDSVDSVVFTWRLMGTDLWQSHPMIVKTPGRQVYEIALPGLKQDFEYYVQASVAGTKLYFPATYPPLPQTVIVM